MSKENKNIEDFQRKDLSLEWTTLQNQFDSYEKYSLLIKLFNLSVAVSTLLLSQWSIWIGIIMLSVWFLDAIWKTFQFRIEDRILQIEKSLESLELIIPFQFNREYLDNRPGVVGLIKEYCMNALRPTIAFPHIILVCAVMIKTIFN